LALTLAVILESRLGEDAIVRVVLFDFDVDGACFSLEQLLAMDGRFRVKRDLWVVQNLATGMINVDSTTGVTVIGSVYAIPRDKTTTKGGDIVITGDAVARRRMVDFKAHFFVEHSWTGSFVGTTSLLAHTARGTLDLFGLDTRRSIMLARKDSIGDKPIRKFSGDTNPLTLLAHELDFRQVGVGKTLMPQVSSFSDGDRLVLPGSMTVR
jgi:hypothetical protein